MMRDTDPFHRQPFSQGLWVKLPKTLRLALLSMRMDRPIGWWLLLLPAWVALAVSGRLTEAGLLELVRLMALFFIGAIASRGAGCIINDLCDRDIDPLVERTRNRPIAAGALSLRAAWIILIALGAIDLLVLTLLPLEAVIIALAAVPLVIAYPLAKRIMAHPQIILGLTFGWGALLGWAALGRWPDANAFLLYAAAGCWTFGYDTIYAIQDKIDDAQIGIGSSALALGRGIKPAVATAYGLSLLLLALFAFTTAAGFGFMIALAAAAIHFIRQIHRLDPDDAAMAGRLFKSNRDVGLILAAGAFADFLLR